MALISTRNLVTPLTNMVNVITVLLLAICFAVLRLSGAGITVQSGIANSDVGSFKRRTQTVEAPNTLSDPQNNSIDDIFKPVPKLLGNNKEASQAQQDNNDNAGRKSLDDIEKSLGIR